MSIIVWPQTRQKNKINIKAPTFHFLKNKNKNVFFSYTFICVLFNDTPKEYKIL